MVLVSESYDNRRAIIKRTDESLRGLSIRDDNMILEVGAGGSIMITPPAKGSRLEKDMNGEKIGGVTVSSMQLENAEKSPEYARYMVDVHKLNESGHVQMDVNGNWIFLHRAGDVMLDVNGDPILASREKPRFNVMGHPAPRIFSNGIKDGQQHHDHDPVGDAIGHLERWSNEEFDDLFDRVLVEKLRRGKANPTTVASI